MAYLSSLRTSRYDIKFGQIFEICLVEYIFSVIIHARTTFFSYVFKMLGNEQHSLGVQN